MKEQTTTKSTILDALEASYRYEIFRNHNSARGETYYLLTIYHIRTISRYEGLTLGEPLPILDLRKLVYASSWQKIPT